MRQLKERGLNTDGLKKFYTSNVTSILLDGAPAWYSFISKNGKDTLERIQRSLPGLFYLMSHMKRG